MCPLCTWLQGSLAASMPDWPLLGCKWQWQIRGVLAEFTSQNSPSLQAFKTRSYHVPKNILPGTTCPGSSQPDPIISSSHFHFILSPLFTLFGNTSARLCMPYQLNSLPWGRPGSVEDNIDTTSCTMSAERDMPALQFKVGLITPGQHRLFSLAPGLGQPSAKWSQACVVERARVRGGDCSVPPTGAQGQGEKRLHACQILLFVMMQ